MQTDIEKIGPKKAEGKTGMGREKERERDNRTEKDRGGNGRGRQTYRQKLGPSKAEG